MKKDRCIIAFLGVLAILGGALLRKSVIDGTTVSVAQLAEKTGEAPRVALTFDDGPGSETTAKLLDGLKERNIKASFFLMGKNIAGNEHLVKRMKEEGHLIGNHTFNHVQLSKLSDAKACEEITRTSDAVYQITGQYTTFIRPPFGEWKKNLECVVTMLPVMWTVDPVDWNTDDVDLVVRRVEKVVQDEDIVLLHDIYDSSVDAAFRIADDLKERGYTFVTVDKLILE